MLHHPTAEIMRKAHVLIVVENISAGIVPERLLYVIYVREKVI